MEFLVTMTTSVPDGTPEAAVNEVRAREAARSRELADQGQLLRLWRPPLRPGEWRTLGLFAAADAAGLETVLASMPLRVWRRDEVAPLSPHPNDPAGAAGRPRPADAGGSEFLLTVSVAVPAGTPGADVTRVRERVAARARELAGEGHLVRLWRLSGEGQVLGLWRAGDAAGMAEIVASLPLSDWMSVQITPLTPHPSDPAASAPPGARVS